MQRRPRTSSSRPDAGGLLRSGVMHVGRGAIALCALSISVLHAQGASPNDVGAVRHQLLRDRICEQLEVLRPDVQSGITVAVTEDAVIVDGVRDSSVMTVKVLL